MTARRRSSTPSRKGWSRSKRSGSQVEVIPRDHRLAAMWVLAFTLFACSGGSSAAPGDISVKVGLVVSVTGAASTSAELAIQGATVAVAKANSEHLAGNRQVRLVQVDDASRADAAGAACSQLVTKNQVV